MENSTNKVNELVVLNTQAISNLSQNMSVVLEIQNRMNEIIQSITETAIDVAVNKATEIVNEFKNDLAYTSIKVDEVDNKLEQYKEKLEKDKEVAINKLRVDKNKWGYESQADFGNRFRVSISSVRVGRLFKAIGLAKNSKGSTEPYRHYVPKYSVTEIINGYPVFRWHHENCLTFLENWLEENELLEDFYSISTEKDMQNFIDNLSNNLQTLNI